MQIIKVVGAGIVGGFLLFLIPFLLIHVFFFLLLGGFLFRLFSWRRRRRMYFHRFQTGPSYYHPYGAKEGLEDRFSQNIQRI